MIGPLGRLGAAATLGQHCPQMTQRRCKLDGRHSSSSHAATHFRELVNAPAARYKLSFRPLMKSCKSITALRSPVAFPCMVPLSSTPLRTFPSERTHPIRRRAQRFSRPKILTANEISWQYPPRLHSSLIVSKKVENYPHLEWLDINMPTQKLSFRMPLLIFVLVSGCGRNRNGLDREAAVRRVLSSSLLPPPSDIIFRAALELHLLAHSSPSGGGGGGGLRTKEDRARPPSLPRWRSGLQSQLV